MDTRTHSTLEIALVVAAILAVGGVAMANPGMLPSHPGYPMSATKSPADGTRTSHDAGQSNGVGSMASMKAASSHDQAAVNMVSDPNRMRIKSSKGAGRLPRVEGALNKVNVNPARARSTVIR